jgi:hypothetical protein
MSITVSVIAHQIVDIHNPWTAKGNEEDGSAIQSQAQQSISGARLYEKGHDGLFPASRDIGAENKETDGKKAFKSLGDRGFKFETIKAFGNKGFKGFNPFGKEGCSERDNV